MARASKVTSLNETTNNPKRSAFEAALAKANSEIKSDLGPIMTRLDKNAKVETVSSGSLVLDTILGGGLAKGRLIEIYGPEASGKTSIALTALGNVQKNGGNGVFIDLEHALDPKYAQKLGVNMDDLAIAQPEYAEQALELIYLLTSSGAVDIIVVDSVAALVPQQELEGTMEQQSMALVARLLSRAIKKLVGAAHKTGTTIIFINQLRDKVGFVMGNPENTTGGKALKYYASQRIDVRRREQIKEGKEVIGNAIKMKIIKNKIAPPFAEENTVLTFGRGINQQAEMIEVGEKYGVIAKIGRSYYEPGSDTAFATSKAAAVSELEENEELFARLSNSLAERLADPDKYKNVDEENVTSSDKETASEPAEKE